MKKSKLWQVAKKPLFFIGFLMLAVVVIAAIFAPMIAPHGYAEMNLALKFTAPCAEFPLGTDQYGR